jgi:hypothetical protein
MTNHESESAPENESGMGENETFIQATGGGPTNAAATVEDTPDAAHVHVQPTTVPGYIKKVFDVTGATDTGP